MSVHKTSHKQMSAAISSKGAEYAALKELRSENAKLRSEAIKILLQTTVLRTRLSKLDHPTMQ